jgi:Delta3-Delta2-enoyl-CoA isomerase
MNFVSTSLNDGISTLMLNRGKVNALNGELVDQLRTELKKLETDAAVKAIILTGAGKFFSFGFDIPEFLSFKKEEFIAYLENFTDLYTYLFLYPKPVVAALNGHAMAGGCMLALASDYRVMVNGNAKIALNEIGFGSSVFAGSVEMLRFCVGSANASTILYSGALYSAEEAQRLGLVDQLGSEQELTFISSQVASNLGSKYPPAFASIKALLRGSTAEEMVRREGSSIRQFADIWYSEATWSNLQNITIRKS